MNRNRLLLLALLLLGGACQTDPMEGSPTPRPEKTPHAVTVEQALSELDAVLAAIDDPATRSGGRRVAAVEAVHLRDFGSATRTEASDVEELLYIANFDNGEGYAILAADDRLTPVLAVVEQGSLSVDELTAAARGQYADPSAPPILGNIAAYALGIGPDGGLGGGIGGGIGGGTGPGGFTPDIDFGDQYPPSAWHYVYGPWVTQTKVGPLVPVKWNQGAPYNYYTPYYTNLGGVQEHSAVGCVAVAMGQMIITEFYKKRSVYIMKLPEIAGVKIDWTTILDWVENAVKNNKRWLDSRDNSKEALAIAYFLRQCGSAVSMDYGETSGTDSDAARRAIVEMGFDGIQITSIDKAENILKTYNVPLHVSMISTENTGHAFLIDGVCHQKQNIEQQLIAGGTVLSSYSYYRTLLHVNFGYNGRSDGYYPLDVFDLKKGAECIEEESGDNNQHASSRIYNKIRQIFYFKQYVPFSF